MMREAYPRLKLSLQWANPKAMTLLREVLPRHTVEKSVRRALKMGFGALAGADTQRRKQAAAGTLRGALAQSAEITVRMVERDEGRALNAQFRQKDYATNVLTFDYAKAPVLLADLVLCVPVLMAEAKEQSKDLQAHAVHLLVHGMLHALGFDHEHSVHEARRMEVLESTIMQGLGLASPY